ncbi:uncharacterized protein PFL1_03452 [Pseudozyma flocculosa PF-1]|uniref:Uncharacterized protein n=2 Tax=Pseudozyma flocculosa TaxID=84751 RepID=A0A5C3FAT8_9BASI|nr:uncharacterized protein PFL1_03452 [Pseudozyma flocculosa PF-1]EPQ29165.1 hypothetical protein PFL1_03452 [Pseudozyma flocculosa PF-1]SPO41538.1 uncharacterized protein PSFLO_07020 [Pseudozyma flocculosa]
MEAQGPRIAQVTAMADPAHVSAPSTSNPTTLTPAAARSANPHQPQGLLPGFAAAYVQPYGSIPPPAYSRKGKARATDGAVQCQECETAFAEHPDQAEEDERLSLSFARTRKASHARAKSIGRTSSDGYDGFLSDGTRIYRPSTPRRITDERELRRRIYREAQAGAHETTPRSRSPEDVDVRARAGTSSWGRKRSGHPRSGSSRSTLAEPLSLRAAGASQALTGTAAEYGRLLGHSILASASISAPEKSSLAATCAALPSLYKVSRGRSANVSPSRRWGRRSASASVLSGSEDTSDPEASQDRRARIASRIAPSDRSSLASSPTLRSRETSQDGALFPSDDDDDDDDDDVDDGGGDMTSVSFTSDGDEDGDDGNAVGVEKRAPRRRRSRRWSSVERDRWKGMRILLSPSVGADEERSSRSKSHAGSDAKRRRSLRPSSLSSELTVTSECPSDLDGSASSCSSSSDIAGETRRAMEALAMAIPIGPRSRPNGSGSPSGAFSFPDGSSASNGTSIPSLSSSAPSTSLVQQSPPLQHTTVKPIVPVPVLSGSDPLLGITMNSIEDMIEVDQVEFCKEDSASETDTKTTAAKRGRKLSWIIGDLDDEENDDNDGGAAGRGPAIEEPETPPARPSSQSYQARLAGLQSHFRLWSRAGQGQDEGRDRQASAGTEDQVDPVAASPGLLSNSWRNLARLPNLILLPGLAARQAREANASAAHARSSSATSGAGQPGTMADLASIFRHASDHGSLSDEDVEARRQAALRMGRPSSPSPSPSPPTSLSCSRQSSSESVRGVSHRRSSSQPSALAKKGRGVANPYEGDHDPSAYVSGLGQPIDPDTELSSVVHLQTFRSRSRSRSEVDRDSTRPDAFDHDAKRVTPQPRADMPRPPKSASLLGDRQSARPSEDVAQVESSDDKGRRPKALELSIVIPTFESDCLDDERRPTDIASAPTSPTYHRREDKVKAASESSPASGAKLSEEDEDGFRRFQSRRQRRRSSGPRSTRPKAEALVPRDFSAFAIDEEAEDEDSDNLSGSGRAGRRQLSDDTSSDSDQQQGASSRARSRGRQGRGRGRDSVREASPSRLGKRQCAVGLFGGGFSSRRREGSSSTSSTLGSISLGHGSAIRAVRSSPDLTYAAAAARRGPGASSTDEDGDVSSPPRGSRGRRGAVKVVASSVGQTLTSSKALTMNQHLRRGPSYPPRAGDHTDSTAPSAAAADNTSTGPAGHGAVFSSPSAGTHIRLRLLSNSSHLLMLSLELEMIKKHKISGPLKPRWGKHRANDFVPLPQRCEASRQVGAGIVGQPPSMSSSSSSSRLAGRRPGAREEQPGQEAVAGSRLKFLWDPCV